MTRPIDLAVFVDDERDMRLARQERLQLIAHRVVSGTNQGFSAMLSTSNCSSVPPAASSARNISLACSTPMMFSGSLAPERQPRKGRGDDLAYHLLRRQIGVERQHVGAVDHDVGDLSSREFEQAAEHVAIGARDAALLVQQSTALRSSSRPDRMERCVLASTPKQLQEAANETFDRDKHRSEDGDEKARVRATNNDI